MAADSQIEVYGNVLGSPRFTVRMVSNRLGIFERYLKPVNGDVKVNLNGSRRAETASSLKSLHLLRSMKRVEARTDMLANAFNCCCIH